MNQFEIVKKCIGCHACTRIAEDNFIMSNGEAIIFSQPKTDYEYEECINAMKACPIQAIKKI
ncbi:MAG: ferredoxin [Clostridiales bacterium]|nr:ferredoxin [Clostridiales bacterium]